MKNQQTHRRSFLRTGLVSLAGSFLTLPLLSESLNKNPMQTKEPIKSEMIKEFVIAGHGNLDRVKELLQQEPNLVNATWDWGGGDFETALGGASHVGRPDIATFLIEKGARLDVFAAAMLGRLDIITPVLDNYPSLKLSKGPHGLTLLHHAKKGGDPAKDVVEYLIKIGAA